MCEQERERTYMRFPLLEHLEQEDSVMTIEARVVGGVAQHT